MSYKFFNMIGKKLIKTYPGIKTDVQSEIKELENNTKVLKSYMLY